MSDNAIPFLMNHRVEFYFPSICFCRKPLPEPLRNRVLAEVKGHLTDWFGGVTTETLAEGGFRHSDGSLAEEAVTLLHSFSSDEALELHAADVDELAVSVANRLTQEGVMRSFDSRAAVWPNTLKDLRKGRNCACSGGGAKDSGVEATPIPISKADRLQKLLAIQGVLRHFRSTSDAKELFCSLLNYEPASEQLSMRSWPDSVSKVLDGPPTVIANRNGFKVVALRLSADVLRRGDERVVIQRIVKDDPTFRGGIVVCDRSQTQWEIVNFKIQTDDAAKLVLKRMRIGTEAVRTATERLATIEVAAGEEASVTAAELQERLDKAFDVEAMTKAFFEEIANWYFWALKHVEFPKDAPKEKDGHDHVSVIRLITRLIFCWFLREKELIPEDIFDRRKVDEMLHGFAPSKPKNKDSVYYRAILQNLFFATLNTEIDKRGWANVRTDHETPDDNFMAHTLYRFKESFRDPFGALELFKQVPFLNGGLFECLDRDLGPGRSPRYIRIDGFSRRPDSQATVPDFLFFGDEKDIDLSEDYGNTQFRNAKVRGLIETLKRYRFTVEESTPLDEEVALDPELAGKIFENLLAAYNPETGQTARRQTGSFYTPREIVNYMVDEALIAHLETDITAGAVAGTTGISSELELRLRKLFSPDEVENPFSDEESERLIEAIDRTKVIDPAVGSGAFPMGVLHKLVSVLAKLDPHNERWKERQKRRLDEQIASARKIEDATFRRATVEALESQKRGVDEAFQRHDFDYGRKLFLIENCLYGVDIQPIAVQIAKMRFFISLIADQKIDDALENRGVRSLPNLETKLVAANTLVRVDRPEQFTLRTRQIDQLELELREVRQRHFTARSLDEKSNCRREDARLRGEIASALRSSGWTKSTADQLASWDPYDQNTSSGFFDPEWMFGITQGFDVVIGNPPYVRTQVLSQTDPALVESLRKAYSVAAFGNFDLYVVFVERGLQLCGGRGELSYILPHKFFNAGYGRPLRELLSRGQHLRAVVHFGDQQIFPGATNYVCLLFLAKSGTSTCLWTDASKATLTAAKSFSVDAREFGAEEWVITSSPLLKKVGTAREKFGELTERIAQGIRTSANEIFVLDLVAKRKNFVCAYSVSLDEEVEIEAAAVRKFLLGREVRAYSISDAHKVVVMPYRIESGRAVLLEPRELKSMWPRTYDYLRRNKSALSAREQGRFEGSHWYQFGRNQNIDLMLRPKILVPDIASRAAFALDEHGEFAFTSGYGITLREDASAPPSYFVGVLNSRVLDWYWRKISTPLRGGFYRYFAQHIGQLPVPSSDARQRYEIAQFVDRLVGLKRASRDEDAAEVEIEINRRVFRLFGLTTADIRMLQDLD